MKLYEFGLTLILFIIVNISTVAQEIFDVIQKGELEKVKEIIEANPQLLNEKMNNGQSPLFVSTDRNNISITEYLLSKGAEPDFIFLDDYYGITPITNAIANGNFEIVKMLHKAGANMQYSTKLGVNYLHFASAKNAVDIAEYLIECGTDVNSVSNGGLTALHYSSIYGSLDVAKLLIAKSADLNIKSNDGGTPLHFARAARNNEIADLLKMNNADDLPRNFPRYEGNYLGQKLPGKEPEPFLPELFRDIYRSYSIPVFTPDGKEVFWYGYFLPRSGYNRIWWMREIDGKWTSPELAPFSNFNQFSPAVSPDGRRLYFSSQHSANGEKINHTELWYSEKNKDGTWGNPQFLGSPPNREGFSEMHPLIAEDGTIYFRAFGPGTRGIRMFKSDFVNGMYETPQSLDDLIDSESPDSCANIRQLITYSYGGPRYAEVSICFHKQDGRWTKPIYMGDKIHQGQGTSSAGLSPDGRYLFFVQNISPYWVEADIIEEIRSKK